MGAKHCGPRANENFPLFSYLPHSKDQTIIERVLLENDRGHLSKEISIRIFKIYDLD